MAEYITSGEAAAQFGIIAGTVAGYCRDGKLPSAYKAHDPISNRASWHLDPDELTAYLGTRRNAGKVAADPPWTPRYRRARRGEPTDVQYSVLAGEWWHELLDMRLREDGSLWTKWSDGERFVIKPDGELDQFQYVRVGAEYQEYERKALAIAS